MLDKSNSLWPLLASLALLAINPAGAQTSTLPPLTVTQLTASSDDFGSFGPPLGFGAAVGISGTTAVVGLPLYDLLDASQTYAIEAGRVAVFAQGSDCTWTRTASLVPADRQPNEAAFGGSLALANNILIVGSSVAVRVFVNEGGTWTQTATLPESVAPGSFDGVKFPSIAFDGHYFALWQIHHRARAAPAATRLLSSFMYIASMRAVSRSFSAPCRRVIWPPAGLRWRTEFWP